MTPDAERELFSSARTASMDALSLLAGRSVLGGPSSYRTCGRYRPSISNSLVIR
jgi:hypothetical protein